MPTKYTAELAHLPRLLVPTVRAPATSPQYTHGVYLSGIGRLVARRIETGAKAVLRNTAELLEVLAERGQVGALVKLSDLRDECLITEDSASRKTRPMWLASLAMIRAAIAALSEQSTSVQEVA